MIVIEENQDLIQVHFYGELTLADFREFEAAVVRERLHAPRLRLLMDFTGLAGYTLDVAWEELKFTRVHAHDFQRIAVVADGQWVPWLGWVEAAFTDAEVRVFDNVPAAEVWLKAPTPEA